MRIVQAEIIPEKIIIKCGSLVISNSDSRDGFKTKVLIDGLFYPVISCEVGKFTEGELVKATVTFLPPSPKQMEGLNKERYSNLLKVRDEIDALLLRYKDANQ